MGSRIAMTVLTALIGAVFGTLGTLAHASVLAVGGVRLPWGIVAALAAVTMLLVGLRLVTPGRLRTIAAAVGVVVPIVVFAQPSFGGSVLIQNDVIGWVWMAGAAFVALLVAGWPSVRGRRVADA